ncbi:hypothetical protein FSP39_022272 [Pinctada imbricata]|uniref:Uncharacterized protein n=1 Tax=Pinctada imbricata TaxID=66713 RepID=A0AA89C2S3_PINIB|nr:hypothetical protein FSP39_022272 [Pinctada imbricata]
MRICGGLKRRRRLLTSIACTIIIIFCLQFINSLSYIYSLDLIRDLSISCGLRFGEHTPNDTRREKTKPPYKEYIQNALLHIDHSKSQIYGHFRNEKGFLTIGIPTVYRKDKDYLMTTIKSLVRNSNSYDRKRIVLVVLLADRNHSLVMERAETINRNFVHLVRNGHLHILHPSGIEYPDFSLLKRNFNDSFERVAWRSKQNIDYSYLFMYCRNISRYYIQLEDDVSSARNFPVEIYRFIQIVNTSKRTWHCLQFSNLGFIGKLFKSSDLEEIAMFILMFFDEQPGDLLIKYYLRIKTQFEDIIKKPTLFQHEGVMSSLDGKVQKEKDWNYMDHKYVARKRFFINNPQANIKTTMRCFEDHFPIRAYDLSDRFFWAMAATKGDKYLITFTSLQNFTRIYVQTGHYIRTADVLENGILLASTGSQSSNTHTCGEFRPLGHFVNGKFDTKAQRIKLPSSIACLKIEVTESQTQWIIFREISLFTIDDLDFNEDDETDENVQGEGRKQLINPVFHVQKAEANMKKRLEILQKNLAHLKAEYEKRMYHGIKKQMQ